MQRRWMGRRVVFWLVGAVCVLFFGYIALTTDEVGLRVAGWVIVGGQLALAALYVGMHLARGRADQPRQERG